jgi:hypothetical protein
MRAAWLAVLVGCGGSGEPGLVDAFEERPTCQFYVCFDGTIWKLKPQPVDVGGFCPKPNFDGVVEAGTCEYGCRISTVHQSIESMCILAPLAPLACTPSGTCTANEIQSCDATARCDVPITYGTCTCNQEAWECALACQDGLCGPSAVQQAMVGTWVGTVTPSVPPLGPYTVTLEIAANGDWRAMSEPGKWNLGGGGTVGSSLFITAQTSAGAYGSLRRDGIVDQWLHGVRIQGSRLQGSIELICDAKYALDLQRVAP